MKQFDELRRWFLSLEQRERRIVAGGAVVLLGIVLYAAVFDPFMRSKAALASHVTEQRALLAWMRPATARIQALGNNQPSALAPGALLATINHEAGNAGLGDALRQVQQQNDGSVRVQLENASFDTMLHWLGDMHQHFGINITEMNVQRGNSIGLVDAHLSLQAPTQ